jgi:hypothetical protein
LGGSRGRCTTGPLEQFEKKKKKENEPAASDPYRGKRGRRTLRADMEHPCPAARTGPTRPLFEKENKTLCKDAVARQQDQSAQTLRAVVEEPCSAELFARKRPLVERGTREKNKQTGKTKEEDVKIRLLYCSLIQLITLLEQDLLCRNLCLKKKTKLRERTLLRESRSRAVNHCALICGTPLLLRKPF